MNEVDYSVYSRVVEPDETTRRAAKRVDIKLAESVSQVKPIIQPQSVRPSATTAPPPESQTMQDLETKLESIGVDSNVIHKKFGKGMVVKINKNEKFIHVKFTLGEKKFIFPDYLQSLVEKEDFTNNNIMTIKKDDFAPYMISL